MDIGIIGIGSFGEQHLRAIKAIEGLQVTAVCRRNESALNDFCKKHNLDGYTSYQKLLQKAKIDAVLISTPHHMHTEIVEAAASKKKHILLEKPLAENREGVQRITKAVEDSTACFMAGYSNHFTPSFLKAKEIVFSGEIGEIKSGTSFMHKYWMSKERRNWHLYRKNGGGMWLTIGVHLIDRLTYLMRSKVSTVSAKLGTYFHEQEAHDSGTAYLRYESGAGGLISCIGYKAGAPVEETMLVGSKGSLKIGLSAGVSIGKDDQWQYIPNTSTEDLHFSALTNEWLAFKQYVESGESDDIVDLDFAAHIMDVVFSAEKSSEKGQEIKL